MGHVEQVVLVAQVDVLGSFNECWAQILVGAHDNEIWVSLDVTKAETLTGDEIRGGASALEEWLQLLEEVSNLSSELDGDVVGRGIPIRPDEESWVEIIIIFVCEVAFHKNISAESFTENGEFLGAWCMFLAGAEDQAEAKKVSEVERYFFGSG